MEVAPLNVKVCLSVWHKSQEFAYLNCRARDQSHLYDMR